MLSSRTVSTAFGFIREPEVSGPHNDLKLHKVRLGRGLHPFPLYRGNPLRRDFLQILIPLQKLLGFF